MKNLTVAFYLAVGICLNPGLAKATPILYDFSEGERVCFDDYNGETKVGIVYRRITNAPVLEAYDIVAGGRRYEGRIGKWGIVESNMSKLTARHSSVGRTAYAFDRESPRLLGRISASCASPDGMGARHYVINGRLHSQFRLVICSDGHRGQRVIGQVAYNLRSREREGAVRQICYGYYSERYYQLDSGRLVKDGEVLIGDRWSNERAVEPSQQNAQESRQTGRAN